MKNLIQKILLLLIITMGLSLLVGCGCDVKGFCRDRSQDYCEAEACRVIRIPRCLHPEPFSQEYYIPGE